MNNLRRIKRHLNEAKRLINEKVITKHDVFNKIVKYFEDSPSTFKKINRLKRHPNQSVYKITKNNQIDIDEFMKSMNSSSSFKVKRTYYRELSDLRPYLGELKPANKKEAIPGFSIKVYINNMGSTKLYLIRVKDKKTKQPTRFIEYVIINVDAITVKMDSKSDDKSQDDSKKSKRSKHRTQRDTNDSQDANTEHEPDDLSDDEDPI